MQTNWRNLGIAGSVATSFLSLLCALVAAGNDSTWTAAGACPIAAAIAFGSLVRSQ